MNTSLRDARRARKISQAELADAVGVTQTAISAYERGSATPSRGVLIAMIHALRVNSPTDLGYRWRTELGVERDPS